MNKEQSIQSVLRKLSAEPMKVEFGKIEDIRSATDKAEGEYSIAIKNAMKASEAFDVAKRAYENVLKEVAKADQFIKDAESLGFPQNNVKPTIEKMKSIAESMAKQSQKYSQTALSITKF